MIMNSARLLKSLSSCHLKTISLGSSKRTQYLYILCTQLGHKFWNGSEGFDLIFHDRKSRTFEDYRLEDETGKIYFLERLESFP